MDTPIYLITGFLESGKTHFIKELLTDDGFSAGERTLLLCCEEGEEEYEEQLLKDTNTVLVNLESPDDLNPRKLRELNDAYKPERVLVEYNAVWTMDRFFKTRVPRGWDIAQVVDLIDATTYALYVNNMRQMMTDGIVEADAVIFNRCDENTTKSPYRRQVRALNPSCSIIFDNLDGTSDDGVSDEGWLQSIAIRDAMRKLSDREKRILRMRFFEGRTQMEVAGEIGISQAQVSRLEKAALLHMKKYI